MQTNSYDDQNKSFHFPKNNILTLEKLSNSNYYEIMTVEAEKEKNRRTLSESELNVIPEEEFKPKRCHSLPHRYKPNNLTFSSPKASQSPKRPRRPKCYTPEEFRRGMLALQSWFRNLDDNQRTLALHSITPYLGASQFHWLSDRLGPQRDLHFLCHEGCQDPFRALPSLLVTKIIGYLEPSTLNRCRQVCHFWNNLFDSQWIWQKLCFRPQWKLSTSESQIQLERHHKTNGLSWRAIFRERYKLKRSWLTGQCHVRTFEGHSAAISCVQFDSGRIVSGSHDKTIRVWNIKTNSPWSVMTLTGHSGEVRCLHLEGNRLVSGSVDTTIKVWDLDIQPSYSSIGCRVTMVGHASTVRCVQMSQERGMVISGSYDESLKIWCLKTGRCEATLRGHQGRVLCMHAPWEAHPGLFLSGSEDKTIKVWSLQDRRMYLLKTLQGHENSVTTLSMAEGRKIISGSLDSTIKVWSLDSGLCLSTLDWMSSEGHTGVIRCLQADTWRIVSSSDDKTLKVWELESGQRLVTLRSHTDGVTCLQFNDFYIVSGSYDKTVKLWDFTVC